MKKAFRLIVLLACGLVLTLLLPSCGTSRVNPTAGDLYSVETGDGTFSVVKVLVVDQGIVHIRLYKNRYPTRPEQVDTSQLSLGAFGDPDGFGIGHLPLPLSEFNAWSPRFLQSQDVTEDELEGYRLWQEQVQGG